MLLDKFKTLPYNLVMKLATGEEIIAKVIEDRADALIIEKPLQMIISAQGPQFAPFMVMADGDKSFPVFKQSIVASASPVTKLEEQYEMLTSSIALPKKPSIITA